MCPQFQDVPSNHLLVTFNNKKKLLQICFVLLTNYNTDISAIHALVSVQGSGSQTVPGIELSRGAYNMQVTEPKHRDWILCFWEGLGGDV